MNWGTHILGPLGNLHWVDPMGSDWQSTFSEIKQVVLQFQQTKSNEPVFNVTVMPVNIAQEAHNCSGTKTGGNWKRIFSTRKVVFTCFYSVVACGRQIDEFGFFCCISVSHHFSPKHETSRNAIIIPGQVGEQASIGGTPSDRSCTSSICTCPRCTGRLWILWLETKCGRFWGWT